MIKAKVLSSATTLAPFAILSTKNRTVIVYYHLKPILPKLLKGLLLIATAVALAAQSYKIISEHYAGRCCPSGFYGGIKVRSGTKLVHQSMRRGIERIPKIRSSI